MGDDGARRWLQALEAIMKKTVMTGFVLSSLLVGCSSQDSLGGKKQTEGPDASTNDAVQPIDCENVCCECDYGVLPPEVLQQCCGAEAGAPDAAIADAIDCSTVCCECDYGILPPEVAELCCPAPDAATADATADAIDCSTVCCECDYGILPPEVAQVCCVDAGIPDATSEAPDCSNVCCDCDYGEPPPPGCCP